MRGFLARLFITAFGLWIADMLLAGVHFDGLAALWIAALLLGFVNAVLRPVFIILTLPFTLVTLGHLRVHHETGAHVWVLLAGVATTVGVLVIFVFTTLVNEPATAITLAAILLLSILMDVAWKHRVTPHRHMPSHS